MQKSSQFGGFWNKMTWYHFVVWN